MRVTNNIALGIILGTKKCCLTIKEFPLLIKNRFGGDVTIFFEDYICAIFKRKITSGAKKSALLQILFVSLAVRLI